MPSYVAIDELGAMLRSQRGSKGLREVAQEIGDVSPSTLSRVENGKMPDMETFLKLCDWLNVAPATLIRNTDDDVPSDLDTAGSIAMQLRADRNLDPATANALAEIVKAAYRELSDKGRSEH